MSNPNPIPDITAWSRSIPQPHDPVATPIKKEPVSDDTQDANLNSVQNDAGNREDKSINIKREELEEDDPIIPPRYEDSLQYINDVNTPMHDTMDSEIRFEEAIHVLEQELQSLESQRDDTLSQVALLRYEVKEVEEQSQEALQSLRAHNDELIGQITLLREEKTKLTRQDERYLRQIAALEADIKRLKDQKRNELREKTKKINSTQKENEKFSEEVESLRAQLQLNGESHAETKTSLEKKSEECGQLRVLWKQAVTELGQTKATDKVFSVDDDTVTFKWKSLGYTIRNFTSQHLKRRIEKGQLRPGDIQSFANISANYLDYLGRWDQSHVFFRAVIWQLLVDNLFCEARKVWGAAICAGIDDIQRSIDMGSKDDESKFLIWRAQTGILLHDLSSTKQKTRDRLAAKMVSAISPYTDGRSQSDVENMAYEICDKAVELASIFARSSAKYRTHMGQVGSSGRKSLYNFKYRDAVMEIKHEHGFKDYVTLVESPGLEKFGDSEGGNLEEHTSLAKMSVCC